MMPSRLKKYVTKEWLKRRLILIAISITVALIVSNATEAPSRDAISSVFVKETRGDAIIITIDERGIPLSDYGSAYGADIGVQRNPVTVAQVALEYYEEGASGDGSALQPFLNCVDWLVGNSTVIGNCSFLEYGYPWPACNMTAPWRSGMAQGLFLQVLARAQALTNDSAYANASQLALNSFYIGNGDGGFTYKSADGWWYEEYADDGGTQPRVLNGMMATLIGLHDFYNLTGSAEAKAFFDLGVRALDAGLPSYDNGRYSIYNIQGSVSSEGYHELHIAQLRELFAITGEPIFLHYADLWDGYEPPARDIFVIRFAKDPTRMGVAIIFLNACAALIAIEIALLAMRWKGASRKENDKNS
ncbi:MAG: D-glucuronyl C5-epimerase family protein [Methanobacteriota archaeon]